MTNAKREKHGTFPVSFKGGFGKLSTENFAEFKKASYSGYFYTLLNHMTVGNVIIKDRADSLVPASRNDVESMLGITHSVCDAFLAECRKKGYICSLKNKSGKKVYYVNPAYCFIGNRMTHELYYAFCDDECFVNSLSEDVLAYLQKESDWSSYG